jgi:tRNA-dihydrouridine synthase 3
MELGGNGDTCRYTKQADWQYIKSTSEACPGLQLIGNGDVLSQQEYYQRLEECPRLVTAMIARAAIIKPWIFTEVCASVRRENRW